MYFTNSRIISISRSFRKGIWILCMSIVGRMVMQQNNAQLTIKTMDSIKWHRNDCVCVCMEDSIKSALKWLIALSASTLFFSRSLCILQFTRTNVITFGHCAFFQIILQFVSLNFNQNIHSPKSVLLKLLFKCVYFRNEFIFFRWSVGIFRGKKLLKCD